MKHGRDAGDGFDPDAPLDERQGPGKSAAFMGLHSQAFPMRLPQHDDEMLQRRGCNG